MNKPTQPSRQMPHKIYLQEDGFILSIDWCNGFFSTYWINDKGIVTEKQERLQVEYHPKEDEKDEYHWMDYLSGDEARRLLVLTTVFSFETIIMAFEHYKGYFSCEDVNYVDFSMEHAYMFSDYTDAMQQLHEQTEEDHFEQMRKDASDVFDQYFYQFNGNEWTDEDKQKINAFFVRAIQCLKENSYQ